MLVPTDLRTPLDEVTSSGGRRIDLDDEAMDRQDALESWALAGWSLE